jgi:Na+/H+-dicarboxylate symporter
VSAGFALVVAIDWFIDRFRTALNVSSDVFAARIVSVKSGLQSEMADAEGQPDDEQAIQDAVEEYNREVRGDRY